MLKRLEHLITSFDFISKCPQILINKQTRFKTVFGGILSTLTFICISISIIVFMSQMFGRKTSTLSYNKMPEKDAKYNYAQFPFMVALLDTGLKLLEDEDRYYTFYAELWDFAPDNKTGDTVMSVTKRHIVTEKCDIDKHFGEYKEYYKNVPYLKHHHCAVPGQNITLHGLYGSIEPNNFFNLWISTCVNDTELNRTNCYSKEKSVARMINTYISYQYLEYYIDHTNVTQPGQLILRSEILPVSSTIYKRDFIYMRNINYMTDMDYIFSSKIKQNYTQMSNFKETVDLRPQGNIPGSFALISLMMDNYSDFYERRFTKFQEVLANLGGLFKGLVTISYLLNWFFFDELYYIELISGLFKPISVKQKSSFQNPSCNPIKMNIPSPIKHIKIRGELRLNKRPNDSVVEHIKIGREHRIDKRPNDIKLNFTDWICIRILKHKRKENYVLAKAYTQNNLCILNILNKLIDFNKLKCFVLNNAQHRIFDSIETPSYYNIVNANADLWESLVRATHNTSGRELYNELCNKENLSEIDKNILNILKIFE
jgi:hypothetical protein